MFEKIRSLLLGLSLITVAGLLALYLYVQMGKGEAIFGGGEGTLPPTNFAELTHPNDNEGYLLCSTDLCTKAEPDGPSPIFDVDATTLRQAIVDFTEDMPTIRTHRFDIRNSQFDFLERLPGEHLPTVISVRVLPDTAYTSKLAIYCTKPIGDIGKESHGERVDRWLRLINSRLNN
ncbi:MAG: hypothetical protein AB3N28_00575 [Kordiimonas sp.]